MDAAELTSTASPFARLRQAARPPTPMESCELCAAKIGPRHEHLLELASRRLHCACQACAILFSSDHAAKYRRVPDRVLVLSDLNLSDEVWESLCLPINLAFFFRNSAAGKMIAMYPSPAGAMESLLPMDAWNELASGNPILQSMQSDVESLLVNRIGERREALLVPIDACYELVGLIRTKWRGLSGGKDVWQSVEQFFAGLHQRASFNGAARYA